jgi:hypothetical protein
LSSNLLLPFFLQRNEAKENRRFANRTPFPALCLQGGFQGALNDKVLSKLMRFGEPKRTYRLTIIVHHP